jgi:hypothetical protein
MPDTNPVAAIDGVTFDTVRFHLDVMTPGAEVHLTGGYQWNGDGYSVSGLRSDAPRMTFPREVHHDEAVLRWCAAALGFTLVRA